MATSMVPQSELSGMMEEPEDRQQFGGDGFPELPENLQKALKDLLRKSLQREIYARRQEVMEARKQRFYDRGVQYIYWDNQSSAFAWLPGCAPGDGTGEGGYADVYNIYHPFVRSLIAAGTANSPGVHIAARTNKTADTVGSEAADLYREFVEQANDVKGLQTEIWRLFCTDGTVVSEVVKSDPNPKYGVDDQGEPLEAELIEISGVLERKVPITQNKIKDWMYCVLSRERE